MGTAISVKEHSLHQPPAPRGTTCGTMSATGANGDDPAGESEGVPSGVVTTSEGVAPSLGGNSTASSTNIAETADPIHITASTNQTVPGTSSVAPLPTSHAGSHATPSDTRPNGVPTSSLHEPPATTAIEGDGSETPTTTPGLISSPASATSVSPVPTQLTSPTPRPDDSGGPPGTTTIASPTSSFIPPSPSESLSTPPPFEETSSATPQPSSFSATRPGGAEAPSSSPISTETHSSSQSFEPVSTHPIRPEFSTLTALSPSSIASLLPSSSEQTVAAETSTCILPPEATRDPAVSFLATEDDWGATTTYEGRTYARTTLDAPLVTTFTTTTIISSAGGSRTTVIPVTTTIPAGTVVIQQQSLAASTSDSTKGRILAAALSGGVGLILISILVCTFVRRRRRRISHSYTPFGEDGEPKTLSSWRVASLGSPFLPSVPRSPSIMAEVQRNDTIRTFLVGKDDTSGPDRWRYSAVNTSPVSPDDLNRDTVYSPISVASPTHSLHVASGSRGPSVGYPLRYSDVHPTVTLQQAPKPRERPPRITEVDEDEDIIDPFDDVHGVRTTSPTAPIEDPFGDGSINSPSTEIETPGGTLVREIGREYSSDSPGRTEKDKELMSGGFFWLDRDS